MQNLSESLHSLKPSQELEFSGTCECGCGQQTNLASRTDKRKGWIKGKPLRFVYQHHARRGLAAEANPAWKGGKVLGTEGYFLVRRGINNGYALEHRVLMSNHLGRPLLPSETVHHKNGIKTDNRIENLEIWNKAHPAGQRAEDLVKWAKEIIGLYDSP